MMWKSLCAALMLVVAAGCETAPNEAVRLTVRSDDTVAPSVSHADAWEADTAWGTAKVTRLAGGTEYIILAYGDPEAPSPTRYSDIAVYYELRLAETGAVVESTFGLAEAPILKMSNVIRGWRDALTEMHPGDRWLIYVPSARAYGNEGSDNIPPDADLIFEVKLLGVTG
ncbi:MAG: FKBP-type peptidyl-prolyl cis-trans isomerase [Hyphomonadaceae bacterium]